MHPLQSLSVLFIGFLFMSSRLESILTAFLIVFWIDNGDNLLIVESMTFGVKVPDYQSVFAGSQTQLFDIFCVFTNIIDSSTAIPLKLY